MNRPLDIAPAPHLSGGASIEAIMRDVVIALLPAAAFAVFLFGLAAVFTLAAAVATCVAVEHLVCKARGASSTVTNWSAAVTGLLYGLTLPPALPLWMTVLGAAIAVGVGKLLFGGLGANVFNPALVGRAFLQAAFPAAMTTWQAPLSSERWFHLPSSLLAPPLGSAHYDGVSSATPLAAMKFDGVRADTVDLLLGLVPGSVGETSALLLLAGGVYLAVRGVLDWRVPVAVLGTVALAGTVAHASSPQVWAPPLFMLFSGGLMLGAVYMATDPVSCPVSPAGTWVYGILIGLLVLAIRRWGGLPEGVMYAILIANAVSPLIDRALPPRPPRARAEAPDV